MLELQPITLHSFGVDITKDLDNLNEDEEVIIENLIGIDLSDASDLATAKRRIRKLAPGTTGQEIADVFAKYWKPECVLEVKAIIEKAYKAHIKIEPLIKGFFEDGEHWAFSSRKSTQWLDEFNALSNEPITADDVTRNVGVDYILGSDEYGPGICGFVEFLQDAGGDMSLLIKKLAPKVGKFSQANIEDTVIWLAQYLRKGDFNMKKLYARVDWEEVQEADLTQEFTDFFNQYAPELIP